MTSELIERITSLAEKYETVSFYDQDPSQFLKWYKKTADVEVASFIAAMLAFGNRKQFIPKISYIFLLADSWAKNNQIESSICQWCLAGAPGFCSGNNLDSQKFYRFYSYTDLQCLFTEIGAILKKSGTLGEYFRASYQNECSKYEQKAKTQTNLDNQKKSQTLEKPDLATIISSAFPKSKIVPKGKNSANKRIYMFLRWMVRQNSPVDLGLWNWYSPADLLLPLDVHVMQEAINLGLLPENAKATKATSCLLTTEMKKVFPKDPCKADFALFGLGVDK
ncbi:MAG: TIGR02757 family protein [Treponema sp.]|nr:TIGR02757 family protein [Treponema sp.]